MLVIGPDFIMTAKHVMIGVRSEQDYLSQQMHETINRRRKLPNLTFPDPFLFLGTLPEAYISGGVLLIECACRNCPAVEPEWGGLALCYDCGAMYRGIPLPDEFLEIQDALSKRRLSAMRYWNPGITVADLLDQNKELWKINPDQLTEEPL